MGDSNNQRNAEELKTLLLQKKRQVANASRVIIRPESAKIVKQAVSPKSGKPVKAGNQAVAFEPNSFHIARPVVTNTNDITSLLNNNKKF